MVAIGVLLLSHLDFTQSFTRLNNFLCCLQRRFSGYVTCRWILAAVLERQASSRSKSDSIFQEQKIVRVL